MSQSDTPINIDTKLAEADLYAQHGLKENAEEIYRLILNELGDAPHPRRAEIEKKLAITTAPPQDAASSASPLSSEPEQRFENCLGLIEAGFQSDAIDELKVLLEKGFRPGAVHAKIGECLIAIDEPFEALKHLSNALGDRTLKVEERLDVLDQLASTYEGTGNVQESIQALKQIIASRPDFRNAQQRHDNMVKQVEKFERFYHLFKERHLTEEQYDRALQIAQQRNKPIEAVLINDLEISKAEVGESIAEFFKCPFVEFNELEVGPPPKCLKSIKENFWRQNRCIPISEDGGLVKILAEDPINSAMIANLKAMLKGHSLEFAIGLADDVTKFTDYFHGKHDDLLGNESSDVFGELELVTEADDEEDDYRDEPSGDSEGVVVKVANRIIEEAYSRNVSDIHIESLTGKRGALVRFRVDGECSNFQTIPFSYKKALVSRFKILSKLDIAEKRLPQDGKIKFRTRRGRNIELRVATLPTVGGNEDVVLRILAGGDALPLKKMGLSEYNMENLKTLVERPYGLVLVVGPTGSGKTTTLHAALNFVNRPEKKIWTAEDPVEIVQDGLRQVQVLPKIGLNFARILRAFLRADPDIIMVGETRDEETANTVVEAALTGHLVFSTLHTNSAPETITRLLGMGIDPFNFADSLLGVLAQRLIKRLCPHCRRTYQPDQPEIDSIIAEYGQHPTKPLEIEKGITLYKARGCGHCQKSGYKGRMAIHELLITTDPMRLEIERSAPVAEIRHSAMAGGMLTLKQDGILKVLQGDTDIRQVCSATMK